jgi:HEAT repeat protein
MPKDTLKQLDRDVDRMLFAGAQIARTDPNLLSAKDKLAPLAARAPALGKVAEQIDKLHKSTGKQAAVELLGLASLMAQVRGAQAAPAAPEVGGELAPLPPASRIGTPLAPAELNALVAALTDAPDARHRPRVIRDYAASDRGAARDLRLLPLCVPALSDSGIAEAVEQALLPALGDAIVPELRAALDIEKGRGLDQRLLRAIAHIEGPKSKDVLREAIEKGGADMRAAAIKALGWIDPAETEPIAISLAEKDRSKEVRNAALGALSRAAGDEALEVLLRAFCSPEHRSAAEDALAHFEHPRVVDRLVALFTPEMRELGHHKVKRASTKEEKDEAAKAQKGHADKVDFLADLMGLLATRNTPETAPIVLDAFRHHKIKEVRDAAARALLRIGYPGAWEELMPSLYDASTTTQDDFIRGVIALDPDRAFDRLARFFDPAAFAQKNGATLAGRILVFIDQRPVEEDGDARDPATAGANLKLFARDPRWVDLLVDQVENEVLRTQALGVLGYVDSTNTLAAGLTASRVEGLANHDALATFPILVKHQDPRVLPALIRLLEPLRGAWEYGRACHFMTIYDEPALAPMLRSWLESKQKRKKLSRSELDPFTEALRHLERDRNAAVTTT